VQLEHFLHCDGHMLPSAKYFNAPSVSIRKPDEMIVAFASFTEAAGSLENSYGQLRDEVTRLRAQLEDANRELEKEREVAQRSQALSEVATLLAHEIRNPLGSLELFAGLLAENAELSDDSRKIVSHVRAGLRTLAATVNNVLQFHSEAPQQLTSINLTNLLGLTLDFLRPLADQSGVVLLFEDQLCGAPVEADPHGLQQVLLNLAMNAMRFMPNGGTLCVKTNMADGGKTAEVRISDSGPGVPREIRDKVFEAGFTTKPGSPGLGLAVCRKIVEQHRGTISLVDSAKGAEFLIRLRMQ